MNALTGTIARLLFTLPMLIFGLNHFMMGSQMAGMVPIPGGVFWVYLTGVAFIAAAIAFLTGKLAYTAGLLLALMLLIFALSIHLPNLLGGNMQSMTSLLKDLALSGGALLLAGRFKEEV